MYFAFSGLRSTFSLAALAALHLVGGCGGDVIVESASVSSSGADGGAGGVGGASSSSGSAGETSGQGGAAGEPAGVQLLANLAIPWQLRQSETAVFAQQIGPEEPLILRIDKATLEVSILYVNALDFDVVGGTIFYSEPQNVCAGCPPGKAWIKSISEWGGSTALVLEVQGEAAGRVAAGPWHVNMITSSAFHHVDLATESVQVYAAPTATEIAADGNSVFVNNAFTITYFEPDLASPNILVGKSDWQYSNLTAHAGYAYWQDQMMYIARASPVAPGAEIVLKGVESIDIAVDDQERIFWTYAGPDYYGINFADAGQAPQILATTSNGPGQLVVDDSHVYWVESDGTTGAVYRIKKP
ncbi:MAG: hypothetical protein IPK82_36155 [Polyangiaceae bacterium]|nr:hypothetical protein [Polyangiaceae bacterium]